MRQKKSISVLGEHVASPAAPLSNCVPETPQRSLSRCRLREAAKPHKVSTNDPAFYKSGPGDLVGCARPLYSPTSGFRPRENFNILWFKSRSFFVFLCRGV